MITRSVPVVFNSLHDVLVASNHGSGPSSTAHVEASLRAEAGDVASTTMLCSSSTDKSPSIRDRRYNFVDLLIWSTYPFAFDFDVLVGFAKFLRHGDTVLLFAERTRCNNIGVVGTRQENYDHDKYINHVGKSSMITHLSNLGVHRSF